jgi:hypothetical protein
LPVAVEPVNETLAMSLCLVISAPRSLASTMMFSTPGGSMSATISANSSEVRGVVGAGLATIVLPVIRAGPVFITMSSTGKFHGMMAPTTPSGVRCSMIRSSSVSRMILVSISAAAKARMPMTAPITSPVACAIGLPCSWVSSRANSSVRASSASAIASSLARRSLKLSADQAGNAALAAATASSS